MKINLNRSIWIMHFNCGGCNGCFTELQLSRCAMYGAENYGIRFVKTPIKADACLITGYLKEENVIHVKKIISSMQKPAWVITAGDCAEAANEWLSVDVHIAGCPPTPAELIQGILTSKKKKNRKGGRYAYAAK